MTDIDFTRDESPPPWASATADRGAQMYPVLTDRQIAEVAAHGSEKSFASGELLWDIGQRNTEFFLILEGTLEIVHRDPFGIETIMATHSRGRFTGETVMLSGRAAMVAGRAKTALKVVAVPLPGLRELIVTHARLGDIIIRSFILRRMRMIAERASDLLVVGSRHSAGTQQLREFLTRNGYPYSFLDLESATDVTEVMHGCAWRVEDTPIVITSSGEPLRNPTLHAVADRLGLSMQWDQEAIRDVAIIGAGPSGLAAAVYAASEGLDVIVLDSIAPGGQAGTSSKIENYLGFPTGISGQALAGRAFMQAQKFGATIAIPATLVRMHCNRPYHELELDNGDRIRSRAVVIASGANYRKPALEGLTKFEGAGVYYGATFLEAQTCRNEEVAIIGGGNSAGQAAVFLAETAKRVFVLVRSAGLAASMSRYLIRRIETTPNIELLTCCEVVGLHGGEFLEGIRWRNRTTLEETSRPIRHLFVFIGASPNTGFVPRSIVTNAKGFVCTGTEIHQPGVDGEWPLERAPFPLETSCPGVFAAGDVRASSTKRVASAVGEGSVVVQYIHQFLAMRGG